MSDEAVPYELQAEPVTGRLAQFLGAPNVVVELRELNYVQLHRAMRDNDGDATLSSLSVLANTLTVDGRKIGRKAMESLPGRFASDIGELLQRVQKLYSRGGDEEESPDAAAERAEPDDEPGQRAGEP